ncbi:hypothetical protein PROFUN_03909 [Planoprotostelium fungivorum]|uniref:Uncharacterized protein n=1 Tax=Planoprotostelium fungivorum TaxID=1890364 RepID=A0A2P6MTP3_9EUKA|nr:hypothetical protein PROFUN_03909 [Planoprotostelium fungivorum]
MNQLFKGCRQGNLGSTRSTTQHLTTISPNHAPSSCFHTTNTLERLIGSRYKRGVRTKRDDILPMARRFTYYFRPLPDSKWYFLKDFYQEDVVKQIEEANAEYAKRFEGVENISQVEGFTPLNLAAQAVDSEAMEDFKELELAEKKKKEDRKREKALAKAAAESGEKVKGKSGKKVPSKSKKLQGQKK